MAYKYPELNRTIHIDEYEKVIDFTLKCGLKRVMKNN